MKSYAAKVKDIVRKNPGELVCSGCISVCSGLERGAFSQCCNEIVVSASELLKLKKTGQLPHLVVASTRPAMGEKVTPSRSVKPKTRDVKSGIRTGTKKFLAYSLWRKGKDINGIMEGLRKAGHDPNPSSIRSWVGRFKNRYSEES